MKNLKYLILPSIAHTISLLTCIAAVSIQFTNTSTPVPVFELVLNAIIGCLLLVLLQKSNNNKISVVVSSVLSLFVSLLQIVTISLLIPASNNRNNQDENHDLYYKRETIKALKRHYSSYPMVNHIVVICFLFVSKAYESYKLKLTSINGPTTKSTKEPATGPTTSAGKTCAGV